MTLAWIIFFIVFAGALYDFKKTVILWFAFRLLFNAQVALRYSAPAMSLDFGVAVMLIVVYCSIHLFHFKGTRFTSDRFYYKPILIAILVSYFLSFANSIVPINAGIRNFSKLLIMNFALLYVFQRVLYDVKDIRLFLKAMIGVAVLITLLGIYESIFHDNPVLDYVYYNSPQEGTEGRMYYLPPGVGQGFHIRFGMVRAYSFFGIHIAFGCACVFILGLLLFIIKKKFFIGMNKKLFYFAMLLLIIGCITSNSKTSYLGLAVMLLMIFDTKKILNMRVLFLVGVLFLVFYNFFPNYFDNIYSLFDEEIASEGGGSTIDVRERQFEVALSMFKQNPILGNGPGSISVLKAFGDNSDILGAEGALLTILPERGAIGYAVYLFTFIYFFFTNRKIIPTFELFIFLLSLFAMEVVSGLRDMTLYYCLLLAMRRICLIKKVSM